MKLFVNVVPISNIQRVKFQNFLCYVLVYCIILASIYNINVKTVVYTRVNGALHIENCKNYKKVLLPTSTSPKCQCAVE